MVRRRWNPGCGCGWGAREMRDAIRDVVLFPLYVVGWVAGFIARGLAWCWEAVRLGYEDGRHGHHE